jgi:hypothetical protein
MPWPCSDHICDSRCWPPDALTGAAGRVACLPPFARSKPWWGIVRAPGQSHTVRSTVLLPHGPFGRQAHRSLQPEQEQEQEPDLQWQSGRRQ